MGANIKLAIIVPIELAGERVDRAAAALFSEYSRGQLSGWIRKGQLTLDDRIVKPKQRVDGGECLRLIADTRVPSIFHEAQAVDFDLIYEDDDVLIVDKPAGLVVHPGAGNPDGTLVNGLLRKRPELASLPRAVHPPSLASIRRIANCRPRSTSASISRSPKRAAPSCLS